MHYILILFSQIEYFCRSVFKFTILQVDLMVPFTGEGCLGRDNCQLKPRLPMWSSMMPQSGEIGIYLTARHRNPGSITLLLYISLVEGCSDMCLERVHIQAPHLAFARMCGVSPQFLLWCLDRVEQLLYKVFFLSRLPRSLSVGERKQPFWGLFCLCPLTFPGYRFFLLKVCGIRQ